MFEKDPAKGPGPGRLGFGLGGQGSWAGPAWFWLGGQGSWAGPARFWLGGAKGPGPDRLGFRPFRPGLGGGEGGGEGGQGSWAGPAWFFYTLKNHDSDGDVNIILLRNMTVIRMLI